MGFPPHAISLYLCISVIVICHGIAVSTLPKITCSIRTGTGVSHPCTSQETYQKACTFGGEEDVERRASSSRLQEEEEEEEVIIIREKPLNSANSFIDLDFPLWHTRLAVVAVTGRMSLRKSHRQRRCVVVKVLTPQAGLVTLHDLPLPHGSYQARVLRKNHHQEEGRPGRRGRMEGRGRKEGRTVLRHNFRIPMNPEWLQRTFTPRRRYRRHQNPLARPHQGVATLSTMDLVLQDFGQEQGKPDEVLEGRFTEGFTSIYAGLEDEGRGGEREWRCVCCDCFDYKLDYQEDKAVLNFTYSVYAGCDAACSAVNVQLYRDTVNGSPQLCRSDNARSLMEAQLIGRDKNITQGPISYSNVDTGCYYMVVKPHVSPVPLHSHYLWAKAAINVTIMANWTTYYSLESNPDERSLTVRWTQSQAYNFKNYSISLHHHPSLRIKCTGHTLYPNMSTIAVSGQHTLLKQPIYTFHNLKSGWYCARVTPYDDRCPLDGCPPLSSPPVQLTDPLLRSCQAGEGDGGACGGSGALGLILLVVGCVVGAVVTGITVAWGILRSWPSRTHMWNSATHYSSVPIRPALKTPALAARRQVVLLVWTSQGLHGPDFAPIIAAFKTLLRTYAHCEVYDYLDLASLPEKQQLHLLASPTTWLDSILAQHSIKVILVATEGAWQRQMEWQQCVAGPQKEPQASPHQAHDTMLYPYLLRRLHDQPDLAEDYSRLFHVRFSEVSHSAVELGNIVSWKRYKIPEHLHSLTVALHGGVSVASFDEPGENQLKDLQAALSSHPQHCRQHTHTTAPHDPVW